MRLAIGKLRPKADRLNISEVVEFDNVVFAGKDGGVHEYHFIENK